ncbi:class I SAM-dependent methyltransferase [Methylobacterium sp. A52T]
MFNFRGFEIPIDLLNMTGAGAETFEAISNGHIYLLREIIKLDHTHNVLEVGCGIGRDAIPLTGILSPSSKYVGVDIIGRSIAWCQDNISNRFQNFSFVHFDVADQLHNPTGTKNTTDFSFPCEDASIDRIILWSVFTHMTAGDIVHYLKEFRRVLKPGGMVFATVFVVNDEILEYARATDRTIYHLRFEHPYGDGCLVNDIDHPMGAVAYTVQKIREIVDASGLSFRYPMLLGSWSGLFPPCVFDAGQDALVLTKL